MRNVIFILLTATLFSCNRPVDKKTVAQKQPATQPVKAPTSEKISDDLPVDNNYPADTNYAARILIPGVFHEDEVDPKSASYQWMGIFATDSSYYLDDTHVTLTKENDAVLDAEGEKTGWGIKTSGRDSAIFLISDLNYLRKGKLDTVPVSKKAILPGEQRTFNYNEVKYTLYATGTKKLEQPKSDFYQISNYRLFLKATIKGKAYNQLLVYTSSFEDTMISIYFAGDIDDDLKPDFIIDTTNHYNVSRPTLYLSKPAQNNDLLKVVAMHLSVGC